MEQERIMNMLLYELKIFENDERLQRYLNKNITFTRQLTKMILHGKRRDFDNDHLPDKAMLCPQDHRYVGL